MFEQATCSNRPRVRSTAWQSRHIESPGDAFHTAPYKLTMDDLLAPLVTKKKALVDALRAKIEGVGEALAKEMAAVHLPSDDSTVKREEMHARIVAELERQHYDANLEKTVKDECKRVKVAWLQRNLRASLTAALATAGLADLPTSEVEAMHDETVVAMPIERETARKRSRVRTGHVFEQATCSIHRVAEPAH